MSSTAVMEKAVKPQTSKNRKPPNLNPQRKSKFDRNSRKRSKSFSGGLGKLKSMKPVLPTKFLLGGNINDPLNLNSLQDEEINRAMNAVTPKSSPIPTPPRRKGRVEVIIPSNIHDPLNLIDCADDAEYEQQLMSPMKKCRKKRVKKRRSTSATMDTTEAQVVQPAAEARTPETNADSAKIPDEGPKPEIKTELCLDLSPNKKPKRKSDEHKDVAKKFKYSMDKIVSPVVPQPGAWLKRINVRDRQRPNRAQKAQVSEKMPVFKEKNKEFQYGNYNRYYGYRNPQNELDHRLRCFSYHRYLLEGKDILDIGCNIGHITLSVARDFGARSVLGLDIDKNLIGIARKNTKYYVKNSEIPRGEKNCFGDEEREGDFPNNVTFKQCNYILDDDSLISLEQPQFDVILCLSMTKWLHLNWGDAGIKQAFRRMYQQLRPGGKLILEPQNWASYKKKKNLTETTYKNYHSIEFFPDKFTEYLLSPAVGFAKSEILGYPQHHAKGFRRHIQMYTKSTMFPSERVKSPSASLCDTGSSKVVYMDLLGRDQDKLSVNSFKTDEGESLGSTECEGEFADSGGVEDNT